VAPQGIVHAALRGQVRQAQVAAAQPGDALAPDRFERSVVAVDAAKSGRAAIGMGGCGQHRRRKQRQRQKDGGAEWSHLLLQ